MLLQQFCLGNDLSKHIRKNTGFPWQTFQQMQSVEANFEGCSWEFANSS